MQRSEPFLQLEDLVRGQIDHGCYMTIRQNTVAETLTRASDGAASVQDGTLSREPSFGGLFAF